MIDINNHCQSCAYHDYELCIDDDGEIYKGKCDCTLDYDEMHFTNCEETRCYWHEFSDCEYFKERD